METNNYVESWHNQLKTIYLKRKRVHCLDLLMSILTFDVEFDVQQEVKRLTWSSVMALLSNGDCGVGEESCTLYQGSSYSYTVRLLGVLF
ncbi:hypothetical protein BDB00DRAFT_876567 [Zychaea mexicana]|uniref:uncharacterized protein n=1 Tax=Zychaea mexicana TaxID=64656 RepID=UPI0022FF1093|nr:uncharacterized protein BDB00DRAFT_876567 [Zychaea mexicana]KAI9489276.1 hypothetical protein BDB00DRAFT_876567 [Zychaea mexicana]